MEKKLDIENDLEAKRALYGFPHVDIERHQHIADHLNGGSGWREKMKFAVGEPAKLDEREFYYFELYKPEFSLDDIAVYVGKTRQIDIHKLCNSPFWIATSHDKALLELVLKGAGLSVANTLAIHSEVLRFGFQTQLQSEEDLITFLDGIDHEVFAKPVDGIFGIGGFRIRKIDGKSVLLDGDATVTSKDFYRYIGGISQSGYLFQELISQHPEVSKRFGTAVNTVRFLVFNTGSPRIESALMKIAAPASSADNFWQNNSILAGIEMSSGQINRAIKNVENFFEPIVEHPTTKRDIIGYELPHWEAAKQLVTNASSLFPSIRTQSWDIALTQEGPLVVEFNWGGDLNLHQLIYQKGMFGKSYMDHLEHCKSVQTPF